MSGDKMAVVYRFRIVDEHPQSPEKLIRYVDGSTGIKPDVAGFYPALPWEDSSTTGKDLILQSPAEIPLLKDRRIVAAIIAAFGYELVEAVPKETAKQQPWYQEACRSQELVEKKPEEKLGMFR